MLAASISIYVNEEYNRYSALIEPKPTDFVVQKTMYDSFFETTLDTVLRNLDAKYLVCAGFAADICLLNTVIGAMYRNYRVFVLRDCVLGSEFADTLADRIDDTLGDPLLRGHGRVHLHLGTVQRGPALGGSVMRAAAAEFRLILRSPAPSRREETRQQRRHA